MELCAGQSVQRHLFRYEGVHRDGAWFLYDQGLWKPDDKICDLFRKKLPGRYDPQWEEVTLDHVIRHRIGVTEDFLDIDNYDMTQFGSEDF